MSTGIQVIRPGQTRRRVSRTPNFPMAGIMRPFGLYPLMVHPVLPGETMEFFSCKLRALSRPVKHPLAGAWLESWLVYVKFTDLDRELGDMFISDSYATTGHTLAADAPRYFGKSGQIDWVGKCVRRVHEAFFTHEGETPRAIDGVPQVKLNNVSWFQNCIFEEAAVSLGGDVATVEGQLSAFEMMRQMAMTELSYEKYLQQYGVQSIRTGIGEPEILRYARAWTMPSNTIDPTTGAPSSAWVWSEAIEANKPKRFEEPGFVVQLATIRPKMFMGNLTSSMVGRLWGFSDWFPAYNLEDPAAGAKVIPVAQSNVVGATANVVYDHRDLLAHGEQFVNCAAADHPYALPLASAPKHLLASPVEDLRGEYATSADVDAMFTGGTAPLRLCYYEGISSLRIQGHVRDFT